MCFEFAGEVAEFPFDQGGNKRGEFKYPDVAHESVHKFALIDDTHVQRQFSENVIKAQTLKNHLRNSEHLAKGNPI